MTKFSIEGIVKKLDKLNVGEKSKNNLAKYYLYYAHASKDPYTLKEALKQSAHSGINYIESDSLPTLHELQYLSDTGIFAQEDLSHIKELISHKEVFKNLTKDTPKKVKDQQSKDLEQKTKQLKENLMDLVKNKRKYSKEEFAEKVSALKIKIGKNGIELAKLKMQAKQKEKTTKTKEKAKVLQLNSNNSFERGSAA